MVDLIREYQRRPMAIEVKAGTTFLPEMLNSLRRFRDLHGDIAGAALVYGGAEATALDSISVMPFFDIASILFPDLPPGATR